MIILLCYSCSYTQESAAQWIKTLFCFFNNVLYVALSQIILELPGTIALFIKWIAFIYFLKSHFGLNKKKIKNKNMEILQWHFT